MLSKPVPECSAITPPGDLYISSQLYEDIYFVNPAAQRFEWISSLVHGNNDLLDAALVNYVRIYWDRSFSKPIDLPKGYLGKTKSYGVLIATLYDLCPAVSEYLDSQELKISSWDLFDRLIDYLRSATLPLAILSLYSIDIEFKTSIQLRNSLRQVASRLNSLEKLESASNNELFLIVGISMDLARCNNQFCSKKYRPMLKAMRETITEMHHKWDKFTVRNGQLYQRTHKGGRLALVLPPEDLTLQFLQES